MRTEHIFVQIILFIPTLDTTKKINHFNDNLTDKTLRGNNKSQIMQEY